MEVSQHAKYFCEFCGKVPELFILYYCRNIMLSGVSSHIYKKKRNKVYTLFCIFGINFLLVVGLIQRNSCTWACIFFVMATKLLLVSSSIYFCIFNFLQFAVKRKAVGIWGCKDCGKVKAGGAYTLKYVIFLIYPHSRFQVYYYCFYQSMATEVNFRC
jgi:ribosomal protein L37AE/L43A